MTMLHTSRLIALILLTSFLTGCPMQETNGTDNAATGPRTPEDIMRDGNHLIGEPSVYLQQQAFGLYH